MAAEIGSWVRWTKLSPTRLGYKESDIGKVIGARDGRCGARELDVQFDDGDVIRGGLENWFEKAHHESEGDARLICPDVAA